MRTRVDAEAQRLTAEDVGEVDAEVLAEEPTKEEVKAAKKVKKKVRNAAKKLVMGFMQENVENIDEEVVEALNLLISFKARKVRGKVSRGSKTEIIAEKFRDEVEISELDLFAAFKIGRQAMTAQRRMFIKKFAPEDRIWVIFDEDEEMYKMVADGADAPEGWDGYVPTEAEEL